MKWNNNGHTADREIHPRQKMCPIEQRKSVLKKKYVHSLAIKVGIDNLLQ